VTVRELLRRWARVVKRHRESGGDAPRPGEPYPVGVGPPLLRADRIDLQPFEVRYWVTVWGVPESGTTETSAYFGNNDDAEAFARDVDGVVTVREWREVNGRLVLVPYAGYSYQDGRITSAWGLGLPDGEKPV
jgi:hypothetical protein